MTRTLLFRAASAAAFCLSALPLSAQSASPVAAALKYSLATASKNFPGSAERMPEDKYSYKPTPGNMTYGDHMAHMADFNEMMCGLIGGTTAPAHDKVAGTAPKAAIVAQVKASFAFCSTALANLDDSQLAATVPFFGSQISRAAAIIILSADWSDHYAVTSTYLRLNGLLPPTAGRM
ncbi:MAG: DinB family protein [bacterium]